MGIELLWSYAEQSAKHCAQDVASLKGKTLLVTGSTGLIGAQLVRTIISTQEDVKLLLPVRNVEKAEGLFKEHSKNIEIFEWDMCDNFKEGMHFDFAIHLACTTSSHDFLNKPVEVVHSVYQSALEVLKTATECNAKVLLASTMEVYGEAEGLLAEENVGKIDPVVPRNSYPEAKKLTECLAASFASEFNTNVSIARLAQTFGEGVLSNDSRVFAEFGRCVLNREDICLVSDGSSSATYVSVSDAVSGILRILSQGQAGQAYNVANENTFCTIMQMANLVATQLANDEIAVKHVQDAERLSTFRNSKSLRLDSNKLKSLGWQPQISLVSMFERMLSVWATSHVVHL